MRIPVLTQEVTFKFNARKMLARFLLVVALLATYHWPGTWAYQRLKAAEQSFVWLVGDAPGHPGQSRAKVLDDLLKSQK